MTDKPIQTRDPLAGPGEFQAALVEWFGVEGRDYPWRRTTDPYAILVSEIMLQQTQIATVLDRGFYDRWLTRFPDVAALALAPEADVLKHWEGLGYYNRARNLQKAARVVVEEHEGEFPTTWDEILALPGVGRYTAGAVFSFAFDQPAPIVDGNVARVFSRLFDHREAIDKTASQKKLWSWAEALLPGDNVREYNSALMELGQRYCSKGAADCLSCPVSAFCKTREPETLPRKKAARDTVFITEHALFAVREGKVLLEQESGTRRKGLWRLPLLPADRVEGLPILLKTNYAITHHRVELIVHEAGTALIEEGRIMDSTLLNEPGDAENPLQSWFEVNTELPEIAMPSPFRRAVDQVLKARADAASFRLEA